MSSKICKQTFTTASFYTSTNNITKKSNKLSKTGHSFFKSNPELTQNTIELYQHINKLKPFSVHNPQTNDFDRKVQTVINICKKGSLSIDRTSRLGQTQQSFYRCRSDDLKTKCLSIVKARKSGKNVPIFGKKTFRSVISKVVPKSEQQQEIRIATEMIQNCQKDRILLRKTISNFRTKVEEVKQQRKMFDEQLESHSSVQETKAQRLFSETVPLPEPVKVPFPNEQNIYRQGLKCKTELSKVKADDYFILMGNTVVKADHKIPPPKIDQQILNRFNLNKQKKFIKSYILKKRQAKEYFLRITSKTFEL